VLGDQCLAVRIMSVRGKKSPTYVDHLPLSAKSTLASLGSALWLIFVALFVVDMCRHRGSVVQQN